MNATSIFSFFNSFVLLGWLLLVLAPKWKHTQALILNAFILFFSLFYAYLILHDIGSFSIKSFSSLSKVKALFQNDIAVLAGWIHYLAFDLFVGAYIVRTSVQLQIPRWLYTFTLPFTFIFGPIGYLLFFIIITIKTKMLYEFT